MHTAVIGEVSSNPFSSSVKLHYFWFLTWSFHKSLSLNIWLMSLPWFVLLIYVSHKFSTSVFGDYSIGYRNLVVLCVAQQKAHLEDIRSRVVMLKMLKPQLAIPVIVAVSW